MQNTVVIDGELSLILDAPAEGSLIVPESAEAGVFMAMRQIYPVYDGPMEITPSAEEQILETTLKSLTDRIVIHPVPQNYGLIEWNGSTLTVR